MDTAQWPQGIGVVKPTENSTPIPNTEKKPRPQKEQALNCPRCNSTNTKFCYYNNYNLSQPRYFCKTCRRYWTEGGSLRNVPVGGGSRKNKRSNSSINIIDPTSSKKPNVTGPQKFSPENSKIHEGQDLNLAYNPSLYNGFSQFVAFPFGDDQSKNQNPQNPNLNFPDSSNISAMEFLKTGIGSRGLLSSFMSKSLPVSDSNNSVYSSSGFPMHGFKPSLGFSLDHGVQNGFTNGNNLQGIHQDHGVHEDHANSSRIMFPFEELKQVSSNDHQLDQDGGQGESTNGYWNGMLGGGSW